MANDGISVPYNRDLKPLEDLLAGGRRAGDFLVQSAGEIPMPRVEIEEVGVLSFPIPETQIRQVIEQATRAPYGRGEETVLDPSVLARFIEGVVTHQYDGSENSAWAGNASRLGPEKMGGVLSVGAGKQARLPPGLRGSAAPPSPRGATESGARRLGCLALLDARPKAAGRVTELVERMSAAQALTPQTIA